jgi:hypothetical protein
LSAAIVCAIASVACDRMGMRIAALPRRKRICAVDEAPEIGR